MKQASVMEAEPGQTAKKQMMILMQEGYPWREAASRAGIRNSRSTAYRWFQQFRAQGEAALHDGRHGHIAKMHQPILVWRSQRRLLLTLLFLNAVGLRRTRDLRGYTDEALGLWTGRHKAYGYWHTERFLTHVAKAGGAEGLTNARGRVDCRAVAGG